MKQGWQSYDSAASSHDRLAVPTIFARPAEELVARLGIPSEAAVLDVGTGTGVAALVAMKSARLVVGLDPAVEMLRVARGHGLVCVVAGTVPGLPFAASTFDRVLASFVLTHVASYRSAVADMVRVLKPNGKLGATAWGSLQNEFRQLWRSIAESFVGTEALSAAIREALPWEDWFAERDHLTEAFREAGLAEIEVNLTEYKTRQTIADFLELRESALEGRFIRQSVDDQRWKQFRRTVSEELRRRFKDPIEYPRDFYVVVATSPAGGRSSSTGSPLGPDDR